jgi:hypothetical protein
VIRDHAQRPKLTWQAPLVEHEKHMLKGRKSLAGMERILTLRDGVLLHLTEVLLGKAFIYLLLRYLSWVYGLRQVVAEVFVGVKNPGMSTALELFSNLNLDFWHIRDKVVVPICFLRRYLHLSLRQ